MKTLSLLFCLLAYSTFAQFYNQTSGTSNHLTVVDFVDDNIGYVAGYSGTLLKTVNGGTTWQSLNSPTSQHVISLSVVNENVFFFVAGENIGNYFLYKTTDGGSTFQPLTIPNSADAYRVEFLDAQVGFVSARSGGLYKTTNGGQSWYSVNNNGIHGTHFVSSQIGYAHGVNNIYKSTDGGETWSYLFNSGMFNLGSVQFKPMFFSSEGNGHIGSEYYGQLISSNDDFQTITENNYTWSIMDIYFTSDMVGYASNFSNPGNRLLKTTDGGVTWNNIYDSNVTLSGLHFVNENLGWIAGSFGTILKYDAALSVKNQVSDNNIHIFPNPSSDIVTISSKNSKIESVSIYTTSGTQILHSSSFDNQISVEDLASGAYFIQVKTSNGNYVEKLIKD